MTTRDPRSRGPRQPDTGAEGSRDPSQSASLDRDAFDDDIEPSHPSLAVGTSDANGDELTRVESPQGRNKAELPPRAPSSRPPPLDPDAPEVRIGTVLGTYRLDELLGKGGMGYVYRAEHVKLGREVALKLLRADYARRRDAVLRFFQEAKTVNRVRHRNIVDVTDFIELDDGTTFIIMELLRGTSLGKWARTGVDLPRALAVLVQICDGLGAAHAVGVVHRDLKPDNVVVVPTSDGAELVKLLDFGVAKLVNRDDEDVGFQTAAGSVIGTPAYMSPEQAGGMAIDHRSDIYSLGALMYELFCGQPMFRGRSFGEYVRKHLTELPIPPRQTQGGAGIDERLEQLIQKSLAKDPDERFGHILELRDSLLHLMASGDQPGGYAPRSSARPMPTTQLPPHMLQLPPAGMITTAPTSPSAQHVAHYSPSADVAPSRPTSWLVWLGGGIFAVGLGITGAVLYANRTGSDAADLKPLVKPLVTAAPIDPAPKQPAQPQSIELRFDSLPSGGVYADGHSAELCRTPCAFDVDPKDGVGDHRTFVVRSDGYLDKPVQVDLTATDRAFHVTLEREPQQPLAPPHDPDIKTIKRRLPGQATPATPDKATKLTRPTKPVDKKLNDTALEPPDQTPAKATKPGSTKPTKIDAADTLDPFRSRE